MLSNGICLPCPDVRGERCESIEPPPGFEVLGSNVIVKKNSTRMQMNVERRVTRSQKKIGKSSSQTTAESMKKLAEESLEIGKILGVKVITKEENAKRRIIDSLKEEKRKRSNVEQKLN